MMRFTVFILTLLFFLTPTFTQAQVRVPEEEKTIFAIVKDGMGKEMEGYLHISQDKLTLVTKDNREKSFPLDLVESIKLEKVEGKIPGEISGEAYYSVRLQNSQELYKLRDKYTFSLTTSAGIVTRAIDPEGIRNSSSTSGSKNEQPLIYDKNIVFSLEFKF
jgi:hypothetical protein